MISNKQLYYALAVEKTLHFKKASELCHVSQSALSTALTELEKQLGMQIFERDNKKVLITPAGRKILDKAQSILQLVNDLEHIADTQRRPLSAPISIGVIPTIAPYLLPHIFPSLNKSYPEAQITVIEDQSHVLVDLVRRGEIDTAILALPYPLDGLLSLEFWQEDFYWVALNDDTLVRQKEITSNEIKNSNLMLLKDGHCLKAHVLDACKFSDSTDSHQLGAASLSTIIQMVLGGLGTTLIPAMAKQSLLGNNKHLYAIHLNEPGPHRRIAFIFRPNYTRISCIETLMAICQQSLEQSL